MAVAPGTIFVHAWRQKGMDPYSAGESQRPPSADELVARGEYREAASRLRSDLGDRTPTAGEMLRLADLLVLADRDEEALPILLDIADTYARHGFRDKALVALRRADAVDPGRPEVSRRFEALAFRPRPRRRPAAAPEVAPAALAPLAPSTDASAAAAVPAPSLQPPVVLPEDLFSAGAKPDREEKTNPFARVPPPEGAEAGPNPDPALVALVTSLGARRGRSGRAALGPALFAEVTPADLRRLAAGLHRRVCAEGEIIVSEGDHGDSVFLVADGSVRVLMIGGHGRPFEIRRLDAGDFFGEVSALSGHPRTATVVAATRCELLEVDRRVLDALATAQPAARTILEDACVGRSLSEEESAVRSLTAETASPGRAAEALRAHFGGSEWSPRLRLHLARLMLDSGQEADALAVLASVAEELAQGGEAEKAVAVLKQVERIRHRAERDLRLAPLVATQRFQPPAEDEPTPPRSRAASEAAFRVWVGSLLRETDALTARPAVGSPRPRRRGARKSRSRARA